MDQDVLDVRVRSIFTLYAKDGVAVAGDRGCREAEY